MTATEATKHSTVTEFEEDYTLWKRMIDRRRKDCKHVDLKRVEKIIHNAWVQDLRRDNDDGSDRQYNALDKFEKILLYHFRVINNENKPAKDRRYSLDSVQSILRDIDKLTGRLPRSDPPPALVESNSTTASTKDQSLGENANMRKRNLSANSAAPLSNTSNKEKDSGAESLTGPSSKKMRFERSSPLPLQINKTASTTIQQNDSNRRDNIPYTKNIADGVSNDESVSRGKPITKIPDDPRSIMGGQSTSKHDGTSTSHGLNDRVEVHPEFNRNRSNEPTRPIVDSKEYYKCPERWYRSLQDCVRWDPYIVEYNAETWGCDLCKSRLYGAEYAFRHFTGRKHRENLKVVIEKQDNRRYNDQKNQSFTFGAENVSVQDQRRETFTKAWSTSNAPVINSVETILSEKRNSRENSFPAPHDDKHQGRLGSAHPDISARRSFSESATPAAMSNGQRYTPGSVQSPENVNDVTTLGRIVEPMPQNTWNKTVDTSSSQNVNRSQSVDAPPLHTHTTTSSGCDRESIAAPVPTATQPGNPLTTNQARPETNIQVVRNSEKQVHARPNEVRNTSTSTTATNDNTSKHLETAVMPKSLAMSEMQPITCTAIEDMAKPSISRSCFERQKSSVKFRPLIIDSTRARDVGSRLKEWDPFWKNLKIISVGVTSRVMSQVPKPDCTKEYEIGCASQDKLINLLKISDLTKPNLGWGLKKNDSPVALLLRMLPVNNSYYTKKRADSHMWPKGSFLQLNDSAIQVQQRRQQDHDLTQWKGMSNCINLIEHIAQPQNTQVLNIFTIDRDQYFYAIGICEYRSVDALFKAIMDDGSPERIHELLEDEAKRKAVTFAQKKMLVVDDSDDDVPDGDRKQLGKFVFSLICPISKQPMTYPVRGKNCKHFQCCDLKNYIASNEVVSGSRWRCASCESFVSLQQLEFCGLTKALLKKYETVITPDRDRIEFCADGNSRLLGERKLRYKKQSAVQSTGSVNTNTSKTPQTMEIIDLM